MRCRPVHRHHVWAYDFVADRTHDGRPLKILTVIEEYARECLAILVARRLRAADVLETLAGLFLTLGVPVHLRADTGPACTATLVRGWLETLGVQPLCIEPGSPWENGSVESFNGTLRDELLDREIFYTLTEAQVLIERWRQQYNTVRPHSALGYRPPAPVTIIPAARRRIDMSPAPHKQWYNPGGQVQSVSRRARSQLTGIGAEQRGMKKCARSEAASVYKGSDPGAQNENSGYSSVNAVLRCIARA